MIIGLTGRIAAGKGIVADFFEKKGFEYFTISKIIRQEALKRNIPIKRKNLQKLGNEMRIKFGSNIWVKKLIEKIKDNKDYIIDGIRNPGEINELKKFNNFILISIDSPIKTRFKRILNRKKDSDTDNWEKFLEIDNRDFQEQNPHGQQVKKCMELADYYLINDSSLNEFKNKINKLYNKIKCY